MSSPGFTIRARTGQVTPTEPNILKRLDSDRPGTRWRSHRGGHVPADDIPPRSYGRLIETTLRIITWNVWGLYGPWPEREAAFIATLQAARPDILVLTESWAKGSDSQCTRLAGPLGLPHHVF